MLLYLATRRRSGVCLRLFTLLVFGLFEGHLFVFFEFFLVQQIPWLKTHHICEIQRGVLPFFHSMRQNINKRFLPSAHLPSSSIAGTIFIPQPSYEVKKSSGHLELSVDTLTTTLGPLVWMLGAETFKNVRKFARVLCLDLHDSNICDQICIKLFVTLQI